MPSEVNYYDNMNALELLKYSASFYGVMKGEHERGATLFLSSHVLGEVQKLCLRVAIIKEGRVVKVEDITELRKRMFRKISVTFAGTVPDAIRNPAGVEPLEGGKDCFFTFRFSGSINVLDPAYGFDWWRIACFSAVSTVLFTASFFIFRRKDILV